MKKFYYFFLFYLFLSACALSPQVITIDPTLIDAKRGTIKNNTFELIVNDKRESHILGRRGGVYKDTSIIKTTGDISSKVQHKLTVAFENAGYLVKPYSNVKLRILIKNLNYKAYGKSRISEVEVDAKIIATVIKPDGALSKSYKANHKKEVLKAPTTKKNEEMINDILATVIQRVLDDNELLDSISNN